MLNNAQENNALDKQISTKATGTVQVGVIRSQGLLGVTYFKIV